MTWKDFKEWMELKGVEDDDTFWGMDYEGDFDDARLIEQKNGGWWIGYQ